MARRAITARWNLVVTVWVMAGQALVRVEGRIMLEEFAWLMAGFTAAAGWYAPGMLRVAIAAIAVFTGHVLEFQRSRRITVAGDAGPIAADAEVIKMMAIPAVKVCRRLILGSVVDHALMAVHANALDRDLGEVRIMAGQTVIGMLLDSVNNLIFGLPMAGDAQIITR